MDRTVGAFSRPFWVAGYAIGVAALVWTRSPILFLGFATGLWTLQQRWRHPIRGYHDIPTGRRLLIGVGYGVLVLALIGTMPLGHRMATRAIERNAPAEASPPPDSLPRVVGPPNDTRRASRDRPSRSR